MTNFRHATTRMTIASVDDETLEVVAQYNPKQLHIEKQVPWVKHNAFDAPSARHRREDAAAGRGKFHLEYTGAEPRTMTVELMFDGYETQDSIVPQVEILEALGAPRDAISRDDDMRTPHRCVVLWGKAPTFRCVIQSVATKYLVFGDDGTPLRAVCTVTLKEADILDTSKAEREQYSGERAAS